MSGCVNDNRTIAVKKEAAETDLPQQSVQEAESIDEGLADMVKNDLRDFNDFRYTAERMGKEAEEYLNEKKEERFGDWEKAAQQGSSEGQMLMGWRALCCNALL